MRSLFPLVLLPALILTGCGGVEAAIDFDDGGVMIVWGSATPNMASAAFSGAMQWIEPSSILYPSSILPGYSMGSSNQRFGAAVSTGDFDADGFIDLLIGIPDMPVNGATRAGGVLLLRGSPSGAQVGSAQLWHGDLHSLPGAAETYDQLGHALP